MLMPPPPEDPAEEDLLTVGPTDELLSPAGCDRDSGFSGGSSASYTGAGRRRSVTPVSGGSVCTTSSGGYSPLPAHARRRLQAAPAPPPPPPAQAKPQGFWARKGWRKLAGFSGGGTTSSCAKTKNEPRARTGSWDDAGLHHQGHHQHHQGRRLDPPPQRAVSSEDSWCSGSDQELSSGDESEKSTASSTKSNGQLRSTLHKARTLCDKWRAGGRQPPDPPPGQVDAGAQGRLSRWFSIRRGSVSQYDVDGGDRVNAAGKMPLLPEVEEESATGFANFTCALQRRQAPPSLPPAPPDLSPQQLKRRHIVAAIVHSENSYVATLQRLVNDYKKPLEESNPPILNGAKISTLFHRLPEILQCHTLFRIALTESIRSWDRDERIGDVFVASFSKSIVLDIYSGFINNFSVAMDLAKQEAKRKSALADFLKVKQISAHDRLSFFGLMVKPVQRFPQFILFLQDLLKHTPQGHHDRMSLQLALTQLESLAEMLNERKREAEQFQAFKETLRHIGGKFSARPLSDANRYLLREDNVTQLEYNQSGFITKSKPRRLLLLNDMVVCVSVSPRPSEDFNSTERLGLKWTYPVSDIEVVDTSASPTLSRILTAGLHRGSSLKSNHSATNSDSSANATNGVDGLCAEMSDLMHDYEVVSRIADLVSSLKGTYKELGPDTARHILHSIQTSIQQKDEEMAWADSCCLQLSVRGRAKEETYTFQTDNPSVKKEWITELRLAQLALDPSNSPAWEVPEQERRPSTKMPLFVRAQPVYKSQHQTEVRCGCYHVAGGKGSGGRARRARPSGYLWVCTTDGASSHIAVLSQHQQHAGLLKDAGAFDLVETRVTAMEFVKGLSAGLPGLQGDTVWMGTDSRRLVMYAAGEPERQEEVASCAVPGAVTQVRHHCDCVFVALGNGSLLQFRRGADGAWCLAEPQVLSLGSDPVSSLLPINTGLYAACGLKVWVLGGQTGQVQKSFGVQHEHLGNVNLMAHSGIGLWISLKSSSTICLYHTETFKHLQDINVANNVLRAAGGSNDSSRVAVTVTALMACKGLLWVGTNVGISLTIPLPRLEGVPIISGRVNISYHAHYGPISFLLALQPRGCGQASRSPPAAAPECAGPPGAAARLRHHLTSSPLVVRRRRPKEPDALSSRASKTLPRGLGLLSASTTSSQGSGDACDVYGLYGELMNVRDYEGEDSAGPECGPLRRSDPELAAIPGKVSTLDRRLRLKAGRPRSLDLSNWSVDSRSSSLYTSSGSEEALSPRSGSRSVSRHGSSASSAPQPPGAVADITITVPTPETPPEAPQAPQGADTGRRTVITLMGGRGYVNWRHACLGPEPKARNSVSLEPNSNDAHIVVWEMKL
ncbi:rho guanine nucleotide exchange factor 10-like protein [Bacillus rossius redtenbacheri]|uniref:rho guanine nucleotide exchange factor 10-like protein n=1 Tax=Bacillus rossius redtenbacheri TaxID=93214 RepID=UPI002FDD8F1D